MEHRSILILSELRIWSPKLESAPESKNPDTFKFLSELSLCSQREPTQLWGGKRGPQPPCPSTSSSVPELSVLLVNCGRLSFPVSWGCGGEGRCWRVGSSLVCGEMPSASVALNKPWGSRLLALWLVSLLRSALHQREGLEAGDKRAGRRRGQGEKASDKYAYPWTTNEITRRNVLPLPLLLDPLTASVLQWDLLRSHSFLWIIVFKRSPTGMEVVGMWPHRQSQAEQCWSAPGPAAAALQQSTGRVIMAMCSR